MEGVAGENQGLSLGFGQSFLDEREVQFFVSAVDLVAHDGMPQVIQVNPDLMFASCSGEDPKEGEGPFGTHETLIDQEIGLSFSAIGPNAVLDRKTTVEVFAQRCVDGSPGLRYMSVDDGEVFLFDGMRLPDFPELHCSGAVLGNQDKASGLSIQAIDEVHLRFRSQMEPESADEA